MSYINGQNWVELLNVVVSKAWLFLLLGVLHLVFIERKLIFTWLKSKEKKARQLWPLAQRSGYLLLGLLVIHGSWTIVTFFSGLLFAPTLPAPDLSSLQADTLWAMLKLQSGNSGLISTIIIVLAGFALLLSAGGRWLVNLAKLLVTISVFYLVLTAFVLYA